MTDKNVDEKNHKKLSFKGERRGRPKGSFSKVMREAVQLTRKYPEISSKELARLLTESKYKVSLDYSRKLRRRAREFLSRSGIFVSSISVPPPEANLKVQKKERKEPKPSPVREITFTQPQPKPTEAGTKTTTGVLDGVSELLSGLESHGGKFGVELPNEFYGWLRGMWDLFPWMLKYQRMRGFESDPWLSGCYFGVSFVVIPPTPKHNNCTFLIWSIPRPASVKEYRLAFLRMQAMAGECGFSFHEQDVELVQELHYAEPGVNRFGFREPIKVCFAGDGGYVVFDRSMDLDETEYSDVDTFLKLTTSKVGADLAQRILEKLESMDERLKALEIGKDVRSKVPEVGTSQPPARETAPTPVYRQFLPSSWEGKREAPPVPGPKPFAEYIPCPSGRQKLEPECQWRECRFSCKLWKFEP